MLPRLTRWNIWVLILRGLLVFRPRPYLAQHSLIAIGPNVNKISSDIPDGCSVDQAIYVVRHGSRYPDPGAYEEWQALHEAVFFPRTVHYLTRLTWICRQIQSASFRASGSLEFLSDWKPVLSHPEEQIAQVSITGYKEL